MFGSQKAHTHTNSFQHARRARLPHPCALWLMWPPSLYGGARAYCFVCCVCRRAFSRAHCNMPVSSCLSSTQCRVGRNKMRRRAQHSSRNASPHSTPSCETLPWRLRRQRRRQNVGDAPRLARPAFNIQITPKPRLELRAKHNTNTFLALFSCLWQPSSIQSRARLQSQETARTMQSLRSLGSSRSSGRTVSHTRRSLACRRPPAVARRLLVPRASSSEVCVCAKNGASERGESWCCCWHV